MLRELCPRLREALERQGFEKPTPIQEKAYTYVSMGVHLVITSPTGTGKTEAALLPIYNQMCMRGAGRISLIYVTPLRALNRDILRRVLRIADMIGVDVALRHGDTTQSRRRQIAENPPHILVTTPETLQYLLLDERFRRAFRNLRWIVVDELHELMGSKRGSELAIVLERLEEVAGHRIQRIGLSATLGRPEEAARFLGGIGRHVHVVSHEGLRELDVRVIAPGSSGEGFEKESQVRLRVLTETIKGTEGKVLLFANTRDTAEFLASRLSRMLGQNAVRVHHGSLSRTERLEAERLFREGEVKVLIATSSMELGIDVGNVDLVIQYMSPRQASRLVQRVGRSRHRAGETARGIVVSVGSLDDLIESMVLAARAMRGDLETPRIYEAPLDALAHQLAGMVIERRRVSLKHAYSLVSKSWPYRNLSLGELEELSELMEKLGIIRMRGGWLHLGRRTYSYYYSVSMIPDKRSILAVDADTRRPVGRLDADFVASRCDEGALIILAGRVWKVVSVEEDKVYLSRVEVGEGVLPAWEGELIPVDYKAAREACSLYGRIMRGRVELDYLISKEYLDRIKELLDRHAVKGHPVPSPSLIYIESTGRNAFIHVCLGSKGNELLGLLVSGTLARLYGIRAAYRSTPYRVIISGNRLDAGMVRRVLEELASKASRDALESYSRSLAQGTGMFRWKLIQVAKRMGAVEPGSEASISRAMLRYLASTLMGDEAWKEMLVDKLDLDAVLRLLSSIRRGAVRIVARNVPEPSPISKETLEQIYRFFDAVESGMPRSLLSEVVKRRLMGKNVRLICMKCGYSWVARIADLPERIVCPKCGAGFVAAVRPEDRDSPRIVRRALRGGPLSKPEARRLEELKEAGALILSYGKPVVIALSAYGVGPRTAARLLRRLKFGEEEFYVAISEAERQFLRTRKYWNH